MQQQKFILWFVITSMLLFVIVSKALAVGYSDSISFDFGTASSQLASGWIRATETTLWDDALGYGWNNITDLISIDRATGTDVKRDFVYQTSPSVNYTFSVSLADNGLYMLTGYFGEMTFGTNNMSVTAEEVHLETFAEILAGGIVRSYSVNVTDGKLDVKFGVAGSAGAWKVMGLDVKLLEASGASSSSFASSNWGGFVFLLTLAIISVLLAWKSHVPILNFVFGAVTFGAGAYYLGTDMVFAGWVNLLAIVMAVLCMLTGGMRLREM